MNDRVVWTPSRLPGYVSLLIFFAFDIAPRGCRILSAPFRRRSIEILSPYRLDHFVPPVRILTLEKQKGIT